MSGAFGKSDSMGRFFLFWGPNVVSAEGEPWRKHRRIASPAFNSETNTFVWEASRKLYKEMASVEGWDNKDVIETPSVQALTFKFTLIIFASVGFGFPFTWANQPVHEGEMSIHECMEVIARTSVFAAAAPSWAWKLPFAWIRRVRLAYDTMRRFMHTRVSTTRESMRSQVEGDTNNPARDLFSLLVRASEDAGGKIGLNDNELIGNIFSFLFAGHVEESTQGDDDALVSMTFSSDFSLVNLEYIDQVPEVYGKLDKVLAAFYEGIRMFPPGVFLVREAKHDIDLDISDGGERRVMSVKKGTCSKSLAPEYNPYHFSDPEEFRPSRWYRKQQGSDGKDESEEYTAFSIGPRACLGRKFASVEGVCFLASLLRDWRVEPLLALQTNGRVETVDEWRERVLQATMNVTLGIKDVPLRFGPSTGWAQAVSLLDSTLYVHGGLSDPYNSYSYTSAPVISDLLVLDLSTSFNASSPPWKLCSSISSPALAWHTLSAFSPTELLLFGGQPGPNSMTTLTTNNDSAGLLSTSSTTNPYFFMESNNWANEPMRRMRHSSSFTAGKVWMIGGEEADGSGIAFNAHYSFSPSGPQFVQLPSSSSAPPDIYGHASLVVPGGRLLVLVWSLNTTQNPLIWEPLSISNASSPAPRRDFAAVVLSNGHILIHGGGDAQLQVTYSDGWITGYQPEPHGLEQC
ncbi:cytochrome P450 [Chiua virens]|nr:cytochrome P450 [Chiua virens]